MNNTSTFMLNEVKDLNCHVERSETSPSQVTYETIKSETLRYAQGDKLVGGLKVGKDLEMTYSGTCKIECEEVKKTKTI